MRGMKTRCRALRLLATLLVSGCALPPAVPPYPWEDAGQVAAEVQAQSDALEAYIEMWMDGQAPAEIPASLLPPGFDPNVRSLRLVRPEEITQDMQWGVRHARDINGTPGQPGLFDDPHATYYIMPHMWAPFGAKVVLEGQFPHARYFTIQATPAFDSDNYRWYFGGVAEVPFLDADIDPLPGHVNPYRVGSSRKAANRSYRVEYRLAIGDPVALNPGSYEPPHYRAAGSNVRYAAGYQYRGPWGDPAWDPPLSGYNGDNRGKFGFGEIWVRTYAPDKAKGPQGGVAPPRVVYELPDGRRFFIAADLSSYVAWGNRVKQWAMELGTTAPTDGFNGRDDGWFKMFGIPRAGLATIMNSIDPLNLQEWWTKGLVRDYDRAIFSRGHDLPPPGNYEASTTHANQITYLTRVISVEKNHVVVITGRLPRTPHTRDGAATMPSAEARYVSFTGYDISGFADLLTSGGVSPNLDPSLSEVVWGAPITSVMDDEIVTDAQGNYVIVFSRPEDRPARATKANGVTWVEWGTQDSQQFLMRWMHVHPEWSFARTPDEANLPWVGADWATPGYDHRLLGRNDQSGFLGPYQPVVHYMWDVWFDWLGPNRFKGAPRDRVWLP